MPCMLKTIVEGKFYTIDGDDAWTIHPTSLPVLASAGTTSFFGLFICPFTVTA